MKRLLVVAVAVFAAAGIGCTSARYVQKTADEGVVGIPKNSDDWPGYNRTSAVKLITEHVGPNYEIVNEQEVATGQKTLNQQNTTRQAAFNPGNPFMPAAQQTTTTQTTSEQITEWQIHYRKRVAPAPGIATRVADPAAGGVTQAGLQQPADGATIPAPSMLPTGSGAPAP